MELDALGGQLAVAGAHHDAAEVGGQLELVGEVAGRRSASGSGRRPSASAGRRRSPAVVLDLGVLAVHRLAPGRPCRRRPRPSPGGRGRRRAPACPPRRRRGSPRRRCPPRPACRGRARRRGGRRRARAARRPRPRRCGRTSISRAELTQVLDQVVGEGVVVVDDEDAHELCWSGLSGPVRLRAGDLDRAEDRARLVHRLVPLVVRLRSRRRCRRRPGRGGGRP